MEHNNHDGSKGEQVAYLTYRRRRKDLAGHDQPYAIRLHLPHGPQVQIR